MLFFRKIIFKILILFSFAVLNTMAQTPFNAPFGFFGAGQSNGSTPVLTFTAPTNLLAITTANQASVTAAGTCSITGRSITLTIGATTLGTVTCGAGRTFSTTVDLTAIADGVKTITASMTNVVGVTGSATVSVDKDVTGPVMTIATSGGYPGGVNASITFAVTEKHATASNYVLEVSTNSGSTWAALGTIAGTAGNLFTQDFTYSWNPVPAVNSNTYRLRVSATDGFGNSATQTSSIFSIDSNPPVIGAGGFSINSGAGSTTSTTVSLALTAADTFTNVTHFCFKHTLATAPTLADGCWTSVTSSPPNLTAALALNLTNFPFILPPVFGTYDIYAWVRDATGNISTLSNAGAGTAGLDKATIIYVPPIPAVVIDILAVSSDSPSNPLSVGDLTLATGNSVFIKWNVTDDKVLPATPISLYYTIDDVNYILIASNIANSANTGCTITGSQTGCYKWTNGSPLSTYYRVRVAAVDSDGSIAASSSGMLNVATTFNLLAGNTDPGTNASASAATFANTFINGSTYMDPRSFVVTSAGTIYFLDDRRGLLKVDPINGIQQLLIKEAGVSAGDGLAITNPSVSFNLANEITIDFNDNIYIYEYLKIRKIDMSVSPPVISTIVGGGASKADDIVGTSYQLSGLSKTGDNIAPFFSTPNGRVYFRGEYGANPVLDNGKLRYYDPTTGKVKILLTVSGTRTMGATANQDVTACYLGPTNFGFDPASNVVNDGLTMVIDRGLGDASCPGNSSGYISEIDTSSGITAAAVTGIPGGNNATANLFTGLDGRIYAVNRGTNRVSRWEMGSKTWTAILGTGTKGICVDGTLATSCAADVIDIFINKNGGLYFVDRGILRMVDPTTKKVYTLYGQSLYSGDSGNPLSARFNYVGNIKLWNDAGTDKFVVIDTVELRMREFSAGGIINTIAGNGFASQPDKTNPANTQSLNTSSGAVSSTFALNTTNGTVYSSRSAYVAYLNRSTGKWVDLVGGGVNNFYQPATDGMIGSQINLVESGAGLPGVLDINGAGQILAGNITYGAPYTNGAIKLFDSADGKQNTFMGVPGPTDNNFFCADGTAAASCTSPNSAVVVSAYDSYTNKFFLSSTYDSPTKIKLVTVGGNLTNYRTLPRQAVGFSYRRNAGLTQEWFYYCGNALKKLYKYNNLTAVETMINMPSDGMACTGRGLFYSTTRNSLVFGFTQNGLGGVAEIPNP